MLLLSVLNIFGCASTQIEILSEPKSKVYLGDDFLSENKEVGITPFKLNPKKMTEKDFLFLTFENKRFEKQKLVVPRNYSGGRIQVKLTPKEKLSDSEIEERLEKKLKRAHNEELSKLRDEHKIEIDRMRDDHSSIINRLSRANSDYYKEIEKKFNDKTNRIYRLVLSFQTALQMKDLNTANRYLLQLRKVDAPDSLMLILEGNYKYFNNEYKEAIASYERSLQLDPDNIELITIIENLKELK